MSLCAVCGKRYHPDWVVVVDEKENGEAICKCVWCKTLKDEVTLTDAEGKLVGKVTKKEAHENYMTYLKELAHQENIAKMLVQENNYNK